MERSAHCGNCAASNRPTRETSTSTSSECILPADISTLAQNRVKPPGARADHVRVEDHVESANAGQHGKQAAHRKVGQRPGVEVVDRSPNPGRRSPWILSICVTHHVSRCRFVVSIPTQV